jgi:hypothetical protein
MTRLLDQEKDLCKAKNLDIQNKEIVSPWRIPIPREEYKMSPVIVYFYSNTWIPMKCFSLAEAIVLYRKALSLGKKIIVYPLGLDPYTQSNAIPPCESAVE